MTRIQLFTNVIIVYDAPCQEHRKVPLCRLWSLAFSSWASKRKAGVVGSASPAAPQAERCKLQVASKGRLVHGISRTLYVPDGKSSADHADIADSTIVDDGMCIVPMSFTSTTPSPELWRTFDS